MNRVVKILVERDGISYEDAYEIVKETKDMLLELGPDDVIKFDDIIMDNLGLEPDYLEDILNIK